MKYKLGLLVFYLALQFYLASSKSVADNDLIPADNDQGITETYDQTIQEELIEKLNISNSVKDEIGAGNCENVTKLKQQLNAFRAISMADAGKIRDLKDLVSSFEAQIDGNVAAMADQLKQMEDLNNTLSFYKASCSDKDAELTELWVKASANAAKLKQKDDQLVECKEQLVKSVASSCLPFGNSSDIQILQVPGIRPFLAPCESRFHGSGWTVFQRRLDGSVNFNRNWNDYRNGFGDLNGEFFIGLEKLYRMTKAQPHELSIYVEKFNLDTNYFTISTFLIGSEEEDYKLKLIEIKEERYPYYARTLRTKIGNKFSTYDRDNDNNWFKNCAKDLKGGWWFDSCQTATDFSNLNGEYRKQFDQNDYLQGILWDDFGSSLKSVQMMIRPKAANAM